MSLWRVYGSIVVPVQIVVEAEDDLAAFDQAGEQWPGLRGYAGNGGSGRLIGHAEDHVTIEAPDDVPDWDSAERET
jgi:hypothetical protein